MTSKSDGWLVRHGCLRKIRHATEQAAKDHVENISLKFGTQMQIYACQFCGGFHVGKPRKK